MTYFPKVRYMRGSDPKDGYWVTHRDVKLKSPNDVWAWVDSECHVSIHTEIAFSAIPSFFTKMKIFFGKKPCYSNVSVSK